MMTEIKFLYRILSIIEPYIQDLILVGGFASLLYSVHEKAENDDNPLLITYDVDLASEGKVTIKGGKSIHELLEEEDIKCELVGKFEEPIIKYYPTAKTDSEYYVEFLAPLFGSETKKNGKPDLIQNIQKDLSAQKLRYLDLLLYNTWTVHSSNLPTLEDYPDLAIKVPHPCMYIMQKILALSKRQTKDRNKDYAYIYQTLTYFRKDLRSLAHEYDKLISNFIWKKWYCKFVAIAQEIFDTPVKDGPIEGSQLLDDVTPEMISAAVMNFVSNCPELK
jgi:hypothetical protein